MNLFLIEYITAGGFHRQDLPAMLLPEAIAMRNAIFADFAALGVHIFTTHDARLNPLAHASESIAIDPETDTINVWRALLARCDHALVIAPESDHILSSMTQLVEDAKINHLGCHLQGVMLASDKWRCFEHLTQHQICTIPSYRLNDVEAISQLSIKQVYVVKPIDGAGSERIGMFSSLAAVNAWQKSIMHDTSDYILQPYIVGEPASFSMLCRTGQAQVLSCNTQCIAIDAYDQHGYASMKYTGGVVNAKPELYAVFNALAQKIALSCHDLNGLVGVDVIVQYAQSGAVAEVYVVEINPRLTSSYVGLHASLGVNPAQLLLEYAQHPSCFSYLPATIKPVEILL